MSKQKVFITRPDYPGRGPQLLKEKFHVECYHLPQSIPREELLQRVRGANAIFCISTDTIDKAVLDASGPQLKVIATMSLGFEHIDLEECKRRGIQVCNAPNPLSVSCVAEFTVGLLLAASRKIMEAAGAIQRGEWVHTWTPTWYVGRGLTNAVVGIVGMGRIGRAVLERILPFKPSDVYYYDVYHPISEAEAMGAQFVAFEDLLKKSDFVIAICNLTDQSRGLFNSKAFALMKKNAVFVNASRGAVVDQDALIHALKTKQIKAAAVDVMYPEPLPMNHELANLPNIVVTPHIAAAEETAMAKLSYLTAENITEVLEGRKPLTPAF